MTTPIIVMEHVKIQFDGTWVHTDINLTVNTGDVLAIVGTSGSGKTTLMREILMLLKPNAGSIRVFDQELINASPSTKLRVQRRWGVLFQQNALFSSLTVLENVMFPLTEHTNIKASTCRELALLKILLVGLPIDAALKYPSQLSGGMQKRAALARAIVLDPELLFLDEPGSGLDPDSAKGLDELILSLRNSLGLTIVMISHDLSSIKTVSNRVAFLNEGKVLAVAPMQELIQHQDPIIRDFFKKD